MNIREFTENLVDEIITLYENSEPRRISMIIRGKCYICNDKRLTPLDIDVSYEEYSNNRYGWIHCSRCSRYINEYLKYKAPYSLDKDVKSFEGRDIKFLRMSSSSKAINKETFIQRAQLGSGLYRSSMNHMCKSMFMIKTNKTIYHGISKKNWKKHIYTTVCWKPILHGNWGKKIVNDENIYSKSISLCNLILSNRSIFGYKPEDTDIVLGSGKRWYNLLKKEYDISNNINKIWYTFILCSIKKNYYIPTVINKIIFQYWFDMNNMLWG